MSIIHSINLWLAVAIIAGGTVRVMVCFIKVIFDSESAGEQIKRIKNTLIFCVLAVTVDATVALLQRYFS